VPLDVLPVLLDPEVPVVPVVPVLVLALALCPSIGALMVGL
jgi:hypothetical protein